MCYYDAVKALPTEQKLRGGYYTPEQMARFLADWAIRGARDMVLEPSCGDGNLLLAAARTAQSLQWSGDTPTIWGMEIESREAERAAERLCEAGVPPGMVRVEVGDFFQSCEQWLAEGRKFDAIVGNPPFIRYQNWIDQHRGRAFRIMEQARLHPTRLTNSWVPFLVASTLLLSDHGRIGMVIPAELLQVSYAAELRQFLSDQYSKITLVTFRKLLFEGIQQEVVLVLGERNGDQHTGIRTVALDDLNDLTRYEHPDFSGMELKPLDHGSEKWTRYFLTGAELELLRRLESHPDITRSGKVIDVDVGVVTGLNEFFVLTRDQVRSLGLAPHAIRLVSRSSHLGAVLFDGLSWEANANAGLPAYLLALADVPRSQLSPEVLAYVEQGEAKGINHGYKCRIRKNWYVVPSVWPPDAFLLRQIHGYPKLTVNLADATSTDTIHRVRLLNGRTGTMLAAAFINSLTFAHAELVGRSYGGGVLELEPTEAEKLLLPLEGAEKLDVGETDYLLARGDVDEALDRNDKILLVEGLGLSNGEVTQIRDVWRKLRDRRAQRR